MGQKDMRPPYWKAPLTPVESKSGPDMERRCPDEA